MKPSTIALLAAEAAGQAGMELMEGPVVVGVQYRALQVRLWFPINFMMRLLAPGERLSISWQMMEAQVPS